tara:strand:+ start:121 stop:624 length:504 start_codon:yes stop_codon:yes gene_type:complete
MTRAVTLASLADQNILSVDGVNDRVGIGSTQPTTKLDVDGTVTATSFVGDGTGLTGVASTNFIITGTAATFTGGINANQITVTGVSTLAAVTGTTGTFSGNVSIGGTLTYEDVTNIDSVGIITANSGIEVAGIVTAKAGAAVTYYGDGSGLTGVSSWEIRDTWLYYG